MIKNNSFNKKLSVMNLYCFIILFLVIFQSGSVQLALSTDESSMQSQICAIALAILLLPFILVEIKKLKNLYAFTFIIMCFFLIIEAFKYPESISSLLIRFLWFYGFLGYCYYCKKKNMHIMRIFSEIVVALASLALILWFLISICGLYNLGFTATKLSYSVTYYIWHGLFGYTPFYSINIMGFKAYRMQGMFWEPGVYQLYLNLAIYHFLFERNAKNDIKKLIILYINLFLTLSTTGMCIGILLLGVYITNLPKFRKSKKLLIVISTVNISIACGYVIFVKAMESVQNAAVGGIGSMATRFSDLIIGFRLFFENFFIGAGYGNEKLFELSQGWGRGSSNGLIYWMYMMGIIGLVIVIFPFIRNIRKSKDKVTKRKRILLFIIFILCNLSEPLYYAPLNWFWVASEYIKLIMSFSKSTVSVEICEIF